MGKMTIKLVFDVDARVERVEFLLREKGNKQRLRIDTVGDTDRVGRGKMNERLALP